ncbi:hypothetical protein N7457_001256 [Penicillium paradoxum]|uniref:uncharacterized protein n=1 Tax=Penicillium paradoxum TaxID=176176 RepID=UPI002547BA2C|nr:uncharacterized protein N7457_001256 [Penicillium paradoxum]KAJ5794657.1 hypothetical protein N7457_001256 [Penicillium paradoxum]
MMPFNPNLPGAGRHAAESSSSSTSKQILPPVTQATSLPKESPATLLDIAKLTPQSSTTIWCTEVLHVLRPFKLESIVSSELPKPLPADINYPKWKYWTHIVAAWLFRQVDDSVKLRVKQHSNEIVYADDIFRNIKEVSLYNHAAYVAREWQKWEDLNRGDYSTAASFILAYQNQFNRLKAENHEPACDFALARLFAALEGEIMPVPFIREEVRDLGRPADYQLFTYYCRVLINESRNPVPGDAPPSSSGASSGRRLVTDISYRGWRASTKGKGARWD